ncbi:hypothetical protein CR513_37769, partial [Mucuna pruriens]
MPRWRHSTRRRKEKFTLPIHESIGTELGVQRKNPRIPKLTRREEEPYKERRHEEESQMRYEEEPHRERWRYFESPNRDEREVPKRALMDTLKCPIPPFVGDEDMESYLD